MNIKHSTNHNSPRLHYLDAVRAFALLLGIVFHASLSFIPIFIGWAVMDISTSDFVSYFIHLSHSFRMPLFFMLAGFFSHMAINKTTLQYFVRSRLLRLVIPFVIGWFLLRPLLVAGWVLGADSMRGDVDYLNALNQAFNTFYEFPSNLLIGTHLWFLYYLILLSACLTIGIVLFNKMPIVAKNLTQRCNRLLSTVEHKPWILSLLLFPTATVLWLINAWGLDTPDKSLMPNWPVFGLYALFFGFGIMLHNKPILLEKIVNVGKAKLCFMLVTPLLSLWLASFEANPIFGNYSLTKLVFSFGYALMMWSLIILSLNLGKAIFTKPNKVVRYFADASFWLYFIHLPIVIFLQVAFAEIEIYWLLKLLFISLLTVAISLVLYELIIKTTWAKRIFIPIKKNI